jgi:L-threonylcarbamoyladenylate synthase
MTVNLVRVDPAAPDPAAINWAARVVCAGGLVAFPTETVYGLGADGLDAVAVERIFTVKGRPAEKGLILHLADRKPLVGLVEEAPAAAERLMDAFTPGPLTLVLRARPMVPAVVRGGGETVAIRWPDHPVARALILAAGRPIAAPSANRSGDPPALEAADVARVFGDQVDLILDGGPAPLRVPSTLVDLTTSPPRVLREGAIPAERVREVLNGPIR